MEITGRDQWAAWQDRRLPPVEKVREGIWCVPIAFDAPVRHTFCYIVVGDDRAAWIIDPGWHSAEGGDALASTLAALGVSRVEGTLVTHYHPDHLGMAAEVRRRYGGWLAMSDADRAVVDVFDDPSRLDALDRQWLHAAGVPESRLAGVVLSPQSVQDTARLARPDRSLADGDLLTLPGRSLRVVATPGHTPGHVCFVEEAAAVVFTGDHVLPRITPNVGMTSTGHRAHVLADYLASLDRIARWGALEALPAHEYRFRGLGERAAELSAHHAARSDEIATAVADGADTTWLVASRVQWARPWDAFDGVNLRAALGETSAHLHHLVDAGRLAIHSAPGDPVRFQPVG
jgi:glyoxylase-like metal-dependent hydrolase (beta-lactamase superfamily II)